LVVLALSDEDQDSVEDYVAQAKLGLRVGAEFTNAADWGAGHSYPSAALVNTQGELIWLGHPRAVGSKLIEQALAPAK
jgi:hypothetical protein